MIFGMDGGYFPGFARYQLHKLSKEIIKVRKRFIVLPLLVFPQFACVQAQPTSSDIVPFPMVQTASPPVSSTANAGFTLDTPIETIAADPFGAAVINKDVPGLLTDPSYGVFQGMSLNSVASLSRGQLTKEMLTQTEADLKVLHTVASSEQ